MLGYHLNYRSVSVSLYTLPTTICHVYHFPLKKLQYVMCIIFFFLFIPWLLYKRKKWKNKNDKLWLMVNKMEHPHWHEPLFNKLRYIFRKKCSNLLIIRAYQNFCTRDTQIQYHYKSKPSGGSFMWYYIISVITKNKFNIYFLHY